MTWPFGVLCLAAGNEPSTGFKADDGAAVTLQRCAENYDEASQQWEWPEPWPKLPVGRVNPEHAKLRCKKSGDCREDGGYCCCQHHGCSCDPCFECCRDKNAVEGSCPAWCQCPGAAPTATVDKPAVATNEHFPRALGLGSRIEAQWSDGYWYGGKVKAVESLGSGARRYLVLYDDGDELAGVPAQHVVPMQPFPPGSRIFARRHKGNLYHPAKVMEAKPAPLDRAGFHYTVVYADGVTEATLPGAYARRDFVTVAKQHGLKTPKSRRKAAPVVMPVTPGTGDGSAGQAANEQLMASVMALLTGKIALGNGEAHGSADPTTLAQLGNLESGGRTSVNRPSSGGGGGVQRGLPELLRDLMTSSTSTWCVPAEEDNTVCAKPRFRNWKELMTHQLMERYSRTLGQLGGFTIPGVNGQNVRVQMVEAPRPGQGTLHGSSTLGQAPARHYWGAGTFQEMSVLTNAEMLDTERDILALGGAYGFKPFAPPGEAI